MYFKLIPNMLLNTMGIGDWGWGLGIGDWGLGNPQSPIPNPQIILFLSIINHNS